MFKKILLPVLLLLMAEVCAAEELVNLKYLLRETNSIYSAEWDRDSITVASGDKEVKMMLNYPYVVSGKRIIRVDTPVFVNGANVFLSQATFDTVNVLLSRENPKTVITPVLKAAAAATAVATVVPVKTPVSDEIRIVEEDTAQKKSGSRKKKEGPFVIIIDPGHGGNDPGAIGPGGFQEKTAVLDIGLKLREHLKTNKDLKILMTRDKDIFIPLKERAEFANKNKADLFISIHCNAARNRAVQGTRSYIYSRTASSREAAEAAKFENSRGGSFDVLLNDLKKGAFEYLSIESAGYIQSSLVKKLKLKWLPTERAPFYVLARTSMPSVLVECAFISNREEEKKLADENFRKSVAAGIHSGILDYLERVL
ncbi:MAG: N-acetylmuramoyl-L-alanine amidase AmiC precursor [Candidatus Aerophobetes bacterium ADurb.Bin490]|nr:MAG: N-acetylmuramoyl-L-alanine amidase AmiC precursor [Candidatus Aerophobetes bacterium ADurb.Bin490]HNZ28906.1 N-acetylmuramoyl-L-alanine amidase [Candidatus Goldiibacteriota bacterium]HPI03109.1 N-acetylmuramoyl-L-alanine amidase [Candidatus Goldiibacteriota bacterium]HPN63966.1 N-acetylmuramoyl-L-alanine amidase [Candidatus Goldiibacteriota bacterium]HRQ43116.1 N-acetylmuramoyl-L-alanine amidase [Candidatus Goldiibacteriota bacterium]